ncbi:hypothetical protein A1O7_09016 [Cladophialophora yegresii CBS 114405]|uniref:FAD/NAD(P)-binding domain-containing protein n=1 Tax=Cladophialophora yegresii CBS 114405 TaxID=1182544 RepID=W9VSU4_9EURO|nr:uncharacterized protein A1O7_09016 [Cladophialophora yegresii CBS 114405]EXJ56085.1 hypothetical protein A1O7_09016 [Cladophialophora yegresii CBS 114405]
MGSVGEKNYDAIIVGAGFSGLYLLHELRKAGFTVKLIEAGSGPGGIWHLNRYPGARVDTEVPQYSYSDPATWSTWHWKQRFPDRDELVTYFEHVVAVWDLKPHIVWNTRVTAAHWNESENLWKIEVNGDQYDNYICKFFCPCTGFAAKSYTPPFPGLDTFKGRVYHSGHWPVGEVNLAGQRVAVIGTGATGVQAIQEIGRVASHLTVVMRTPNTAIPMKNTPIDGPRNSYFKEQLPEWKKKQATTFAGFTYDFRPGKIMDLPKEKRREIYEELFNTGGLHFWLGTFNDVLANREANEESYQYWREQVLKRIKNPEKARILAPEKQIDPFGTKRISLEQNFFETLDQDNVDIIYTRESPIKQFVPTGIETEDGTVHEFDVLVLATGFDFVTGGLTQIDIRGIGNQTVKDKFAKGVYTNLGMTIHGFPNMFFMYGPQAPTAFVTGPVSAEAQGKWIVDCITHITKNNYKSINATEEAEQEWRAHVNEGAEQGLFKEAHSWYFGDNIPGKPREALNYMAGMPLYKQKCQEAVDAGYKGFELVK